jgi:HSP20 family protein
LRLLTKGQKRCIGIKFENDLGKTTKSRLLEIKYKKGKIMVRLVRFNREPAFGNLFNRFFEGEFNNSSLNPATNIKETDDAFELRLLVPGYNKDLINIELDENVLTISAEVEAEKEDLEWRKEYTTESFSRSFRLPKTVDIDAIKAEQKDGVLQLEIPKKKEEQKLKKLIAIA